MNYLEELASRRRFGMRPGLEAIRRASAAFGDPHTSFSAIHVAGTNGKGAVTAILDAALRAGGLRVGRYTSPHLVRLNERFFLDGKPVDDTTLERLSQRVAAVGDGLTFFEALTAVAFLLFAETKPDYAILECGLGGRLDATNICRPFVSVITRIGLDHCDWLGDTVEKIATEKAGILKPGVPIVLAENVPSVRSLIQTRACQIGAPYFYAPDLASDDEIPSGFSLSGSFNRENAVTAMAVLKVMGRQSTRTMAGFGQVVWPGRFQHIGRFIVDGAHNPPAARALATALARDVSCSENNLPCIDLIAGFCGDKDVAAVLSILRPFVRKAYAVKINNPRSMTSEDVAAKMKSSGIDAITCKNLQEAISIVGGTSDATPGETPVLICGSLFLAGEATVLLGTYPWGSVRYDPAESLVRI